MSVLSSIRRIPRNAFLLSFLLILLVPGPMLSDEQSLLIAELVFDAVLVAGVYSVRPRWHRWSFLLVTLVTLAVRWGELLSTHGAIDVAALGITVAWVGYAVSIIVAHLFRQRDVTIDTILGAVVTYLLIAVAFSQLFQILELTRPGSFSGLPDDLSGNRSSVTDSMMYFSLVCITTMGYGDIVPQSAIARPLAVLEGVVGQLYLAVMIARLVGLQIASDGNSES